MNIKLEISRTPEVSSFMRMAGPSRRADLHREMIHECQVLTEDHLRALAANRHATANRLGATPSNHLSQAADKVAKASAITATGDEGVLSINHPGMIRAFRDVKISKPGGMIAIPVSALAYAHRPREIWDQYKLFILRQKSGGKGNAIIARPGPGKIAIAMYVLVRSVTQRQDRSLLPSHRQYEQAAFNGARKFVDDVIAKFNALASSAT